MVEPLAELQLLQQGFRAVVAVARRHAGIDGRHLDVFLGACGRNEIVALEDEAEGAPAQCRQFVGVEA
ncbi:hypothetical protein D3C86_2040620 [compost metagenome]